MICGSGFAVVIQLQCILPRDYGMTTSSETRDVRASKALFLLSARRNVVLEPRIHTRTHQRCMSKSSIGFHHHCVFFFHFHFFLPSIRHPSLPWILFPQITFHTPFLSKGLQLFDAVLCQHPCTRASPEWEECVYLHYCTHTHTHTHTDGWKKIRLYIYASALAHVHTCTHTTGPYMHSNTHTHIYTHMQTHFIYA